MRRAGRARRPLAIAKICQLHLNRGAYGKWRFFSEETFEQLAPQDVRPQLVGPGSSPISYGVGTTWFAEEGLSEFVVGHGAASGATCRVDLLNDLVVVMTRSASGKNYSRYHPQFIRAVADGLVDPAPRFLEAFAASDVEVPRESGRCAVSKAIGNPSRVAAEIEYRVDTTRTSWEATPSKGRIAVPAGGEAPLCIDLRFDPSRPVPSPLVYIKLRYPGAPSVETSRTLRPVLRQGTTAQRITESPTIDGVIRESEYAGPKANAGFVSVENPVVPVEKDTRFYVAYDDKALYVAVVADENDPAAIETPERERDGGVWQDDSVEIFIDATHDRETYHQFIVNLNGVQYDAVGGPDQGPFGDLSWNAEWQAGVKTSRRSYTVEFAIPFQGLGVEPPKAGDVWGLNVCRTRSAAACKLDDRAPATWAVTYIDFHQPTRFGDVTFE